MIENCSYKLINNFKYVKKLTLLILIVSSINPAFSQSSVWKIEGENSTMYIGGTIHVLREQDYPVPIEFEKALSEADELVFETEIDKINNPEFAKKMLSQIAYKDGKTLKSELSEKAYNSLSEELKQLNLNIENLEQFKPIMATLSLTLVGLKKLGVKKDGVDKYYNQRAKLKNKKIGFLESIDFQMNLITTMGDGRESEFVLSSLKDNENMEKGFLKMISSWKKGKTSTFEKLISDMEKDYPEIHKAMLVDRNNNWLPKLQAYLADKKTEFILVGNLHLHGKKGILSLLKAKGYKISQVNISSKEKKILGKQSPQNEKVKNNNWKTVNGEMFGFTALAPEEMSISNQKVPSAIGELQMDIFTYTPKKEDSNLVYMLIHTEYPAESIHSDSLEKRNGFFEGAINGAVTNVKGKLLTQTDLMIGQYPGKEITIDFQQGQYIIKIRMYLVKNKMYLLQTISEPKKSGNELSKRFMTSFKLK